MSDKPALLRAADIQALNEVARQHALDPSIVRYTRALGDAAGLVNNRIDGKNVYVDADMPAPAGGLVPPKGR